MPVKKKEVIAQAIQVLRDGGIAAEPARMYGDLSEVVIYLPGVKLTDLKDDKDARSSTGSGK